jgi:hypothetical protein
MLYRRVEQIAKSLQMIIDHGIYVNNTTGEEKFIRKNEYSAKDKKGISVREFTDKFWKDSNYSGR